MKINAICVVKNEADVILETLENAMSFCHKIYLFDNGSTDGTSELIDQFVKVHPSVVLAQRSGEIFKNQLRNRVYNSYHQEYGCDDWWYILDADELLAKDPTEMLACAAKAGRDSMRVWQAQFYFTDLDLSNYCNEDKSSPVSQRRRYYRINWREPRFFKNHPDKAWPETVSGRLPPFCRNFYYKSPICCHYAQRSPEQIEQRVKIRIDNPYSFFHLKSKKIQSKNNWLKPAKKLFFYRGDSEFKFPLRDRMTYFLRETGYWLIWRLKGLRNKTNNIFGRLRSS